MSPVTLFHRHNALRMLLSLRKGVGLILLGLLFFGSSTATAQEEVVYRIEAGAALGAGFGLTDVNSQFFGSTQLAGGALLRLVLNPRSAIKFAAGYTQLTGSTEQVKTFLPANPDAAGTERLVFKAKAPVYSLTALYELHFLPYGFASDYRGYHRLVPYLQGGLGAVYSPEGKAFSPAIPIGAGLKYKVGARLNLGLEYQMLFTLSDKLEGLKAPTGISSTGFRHKDHLGQALITLTYDLSPRCPDCNKD